MVEQVVEVHNRVVERLEREEGAQHQSQLYLRRALNNRSRTLGPVIIAFGQPTLVGELEVGEVEPDSPALSLLIPLELDQTPVGACLHEYWQT